MGSANRFRSRSLISTRGLVYQCLLRVAPRDGVRVPDIALVGPRGAGKTELLEEVLCRCRDLPHAWFDFEARHQPKTQEVLSRLWSQLKTPRGQFGRMSFPRLELGLLVRENADPNRARRDIEQLVQQYLSVGGLGSSDLSPENAGVDVNVGVGAGTVTAGVSIRNAQRLPKVLSRLVPFRYRARFDDALAWFAEGDDHASGYDALLRLREANESEADLTLCQAFLADLVAAYEGVEAATRRTLNCVVVLDNVHDASGATFLELLGEARRRVEEYRFVPLLVLSATRRPHRHAILEEAFEGQPDGWERQQQALPGDRGGRCIVELRGLTRREISGLLPDELDDRRIVRLLRCLTHGHPWTVDLLIRALEGLDGASLLPQLQRMLDLPPPSTGSGLADTRTVGRFALDHLLGIDAEMVERLVTWSPAPDVGQMLRMYGKTDQPRFDLQSVAEAIEGWTVTTDTEEVLHPLLRRLLLHELAARPAGHTHSWAEVNRQLRRDYEERLDDRPSDAEADALRDFIHSYDLALGDIWPVVQHLRTVLLGSGVGPWRGRLLRIAAAPCPPRPGNPLARVTEVVAAVVPDGSDEVDRIMTELLVSHWIVADPLGDPELALLRHIRRHYQRLADLAPVSLKKPQFRVPLLEEAEAWQSEAWEDRCS